MLTDHEVNKIFLLTFMGFLNSFRSQLYMSEICVRNVCQKCVSECVCRNVWAEMCARNVCQKCVQKCVSDMNEMKQNYQSATA